MLENYQTLRLFKTFLGMNTTVLPTLRPNHHPGSHQGPPNVCRPGHAQGSVPAAESCPGVCAARTGADARQGEHPAGSSPQGAHPTRAKALPEPVSRVYWLSRALMTNADKATRAHSFYITGTWNHQITHFIWRGIILKVGQLHSFLALH